MRTFGKDLMKNFPQREEAEDLDRQRKTNFLFIRENKLSLNIIKKDKNQTFIFRFLLTMKSLIKTPTQIKNITESCKYLTELLYTLKDETKAGVSLIELEEFADQWIKKRNLKGAFKGFE